MRKNTPLTETMETGTCCCTSETRKGPIEPEKIQTNFPFVSPLQTVRAHDTDNPITEHVLILEQAGFHPGKSCTAQVLNLTQHIEDSFETGIDLIDLSAAYDTVNHRRLLEKVYNMISDYRLMCIITLYWRTVVSSRNLEGT